MDDIIEADETLQDRAIILTNQFTNELTAYCDERVPPVLGNSEYAAACSSLLIALSRQLGRTAAAFGQANNQNADDIRVMVMRMFNTNYDRALAAMGQGETVQ